MAIAIIENWLNDPQRSYAQGLQLYEQYGESGMIKAILRAGHQGSHYHFGRLNEALKTIKFKPEVIHPAANAKGIHPGKLANILDKLPSLQEMHAPVKRYSVTDAEWAKLPERIKDLYVLTTRLHAHTQMLFNQSRVSTDQEDRRLLDAQILTERKQLNHTWKTIKDFHANGTVKDDLREKQKKDIEKLSVAELVQMLKNIPPALSKKRARLKTLGDGQQKNKLITKIMELEVQQELIKQKLGAK